MIQDWSDAWVDYVDSKEDVSLFWNNELRKNSRISWGLHVHKILRCHHALLRMTIVSYTNIRRRLLASLLGLKREYSTYLVRLEEKFLRTKQILVDEVAHVRMLCTTRRKPVGMPWMLCNSTTATACIEVSQTLRICFILVYYPSTIWSSTSK